MHPHNDWYAHARLLGRYVGVPDTGAPVRIWGYLQHGWNVHDGFGARTPIMMAKRINGRLGPHRGTRARRGTGGEQ